MFNNEALAITYGLSSAIVWGAGDFTGGLATKRNHVLTVILLSQLVGFVLMVGLALGLRETCPPISQLVWGSAAGIGGAMGLIVFYHRLAHGYMAVVAPVSAVVTALIPIVVASINEGLPKTVQIAGFGMALAAVWFLSQSSGDAKVLASDLYLGSLAGVGFALFFIFIDKASTHAVFWPLVAARITSLPLLAILVWIFRDKSGIPSGKQMGFIALAGILDVGGNALFVLAAQAGRLDISSVLASLYPAATVVLARLVLKEKIVGKQWVGVGTALVALVLISS